MKNEENTNVPQVDRELISNVSVTTDEPSSLPMEEHHNNVSNECYSPMEDGNFSEAVIDKNYQYDRTDLVQVIHIESTEEPNSESKTIDAYNEVGKHSLSKTTDLESGGRNFITERFLQLRKGYHSNLKDAESGISTEDDLEKYDTDIEMDSLREDENPSIEVDNREILNLETNGTDNYVDGNTNWLAAMYNLVVIVLLSFVLYLDRGVIGATLPDIKKFFPQLYSVEEGLLAGMFMFGFMFASLGTSEIASIVSVKYIMMLGAWIFIFATLFVAIGMTFIAPLFPETEHSRFWFYVLVASRLQVAIGEAAIIPLSFGFIDDIMPYSWRTMGIVALSLILPVGIASGYAVSGLFHLIFPKWYYIIWFESIIMALSSILLIPLPKGRKRLEESKVGDVDELKMEMDSSSAVEMKNLDINLDDSTEDDINAIIEPKTDDRLHDCIDPEDLKSYRLKSAVINLLSRPSYLMMLIAGITYTFVLGSFVFWGPTLLVDFLRIELGEADIIFSLISLATGIIGPLASGLIIYFFSYTTPNEGINRRRKGCVSFFVATVSMLIGVPIGFFALLFPNKYLFFALFGITFLFMLGSQTPMNLILITIVPKGVRNYSMSLFIFCIHMFGDFPGPLMFGIISDITSLIWTARIFWFVLIITIFSYSAGCFLVYNEFSKYKMAKRV